MIIIFGLLQYLLVFLVVLGVNFFLKYIKGQMKQSLLKTQEIIIDSIYIILWLIYIAIFSGLMGLYIGFLHENDLDNIWYFLVIKVLLTLWGYIGMPFIFAFIKGRFYQKYGVQKSTAFLGVNFIYLYILTGVGVLSLYVTNLLFSR